MTFEDETKVKKSKRKADCGDSNALHCDKAIKIFRFSNGTWGEWCIQCSD